jgi:hypothetical protein
MAGYLIDATNSFSEYSPNLVLADLGNKGASEIVAGLAFYGRFAQPTDGANTARTRQGSFESRQPNDGSAAKRQTDHCEIAHVGGS